MHRRPRLRHPCWQSRRNGRDRSCWRPYRLLRYRARRKPAARRLPTSPGREARAPHRRSGRPRSGSASRHRSLLQTFSAPCRRSGFRPLRPDVPAARRRHRHKPGSLLRDRRLAWCAERHRNIGSVGGRRHFHRLPGANARHQLGAAGEEARPRYRSSRPAILASRLRAVRPPSTTPTTRRLPSRTAWTRLKPEALV